jgi:hypothetical protein
MSNVSASAWKDRYAAALKKSDPAKVHEAVLAAEEALFKHGQEINGSADQDRERKEMEAASADLLAIKIHKLGWPKISSQNNR